MLWWQTSEGIRDWNIFLGLFSLFFIIGEHAEYNNIVHFISYFFLLIILREVHFKITVFISEQIQYNYRA